MKNVIYLILTLLVFTSCEKEESSPVIGTWELYDFKDYHDGVLQPETVFNTAYYHFSDNRFTFVELNENYTNGYEATKNIKYSIIDNEFLIQKNGYFYLKSGKIFHESSDRFRVETITYYGEMICVEKRYFRKVSKNLNVLYPNQLDFSSDSNVN